MIRQSNDFKVVDGVASRFLLGIDTGGTYTDAVLFNPDEGVKARAKALTTRHDLSEGIRGAVEKVLAETNTDPSAIRLASLSTQEASCGFKSPLAATVYSLAAYIDPPALGVPST